MMELMVDLGQRAYPIRIGEGALALLGQELKRLKATKALLVTNTTVGPLYEQAAIQSIRDVLPELPTTVVMLPDGECFKDLHHIERFCRPQWMPGLIVRVIWLRSAAA